MEVDQPVVSNADDEKMPVATTDNVLPESPDKSPEMENDELPALVISDSEGDEPPAANPQEKITVGSSDRENEVNISGITPLDPSVMDDVTKDASVVEVESVEKPSPVSEEESKQSENIVVVDVEQQKPECVYENIDLTGTSSADDSGVSDEGTEKMVKRTEESVEKVVKDSASLTAQELLQSLLGDREDDYRLKGFGDEKTDPKGECSDLIKLNDESSEQSRDKNIAVESTLDQGKQVSCSSENDAADSFQDEITTTNEESKEDSDLISTPKEDNTLEVPVVVDKEASQHTSEEKTSGDHEADSHPDVDKGVSQDDTLVLRSTKESNNEDDDDDVICLLEEMAEEDQTDSNSLSNEDSASPSADSAIAPSKHSDSTTISGVTVESKETEPDSIDEPPTKRHRSSDSHDQDNVGDVDRLVCQDNGTSDDPVMIPTHSSENGDNSESMMEQEQSQTPNRSRPSSSIGDPADCPNGVNTTETIFLTSHFEATATLVGVETNNSVGERTIVVPSLSSEVLVIDDDDDDDDDCGNGGVTKTIDSTKDCKLASPDIEVGEKRPREVLESEIN
ncbi:AGAP005147-PA-like protein [Anopheles sinensis]|uniref:AGAP005147-PA-like protein n=1 Tax=Anopheles sinensis TaxID=74873 RepID=A0A084W2G1_ANOSI|nr:AGAP005147-PA-like protein [Anopheles sinensis]